MPKYDYSLSGDQEKDIMDRRAWAAREALKSLLPVFGVSFASGAALGGLFNQTRKEQVPVPEEDEDNTAPRNVVLNVATRKQSSTDEWRQLLKDTLGWRYARNKNDIWWYPTAVAGTMLAGGYAGMKGIDYLSDRLRTQEEDIALSKAREEYQDALHKYQRKTSGERCELARNMDRIVDAANQSETIQKLSFIGAEKHVGDNSRLLGQGLGLYMLLASGLALAAGRRGWKNTYESSPNRSLELAEKERELLRAAEHPAEVETRLLPKKKS